VTTDARIPSAVRVKICGVTRAEDARLAAELGAAAIGFVLWPGSPRYVDPDTVRDIVAELPGAVVAVGVFVDQSLSQICRTVDRAGLGAVQLHGDEDPAIVASVPRPVIKALASDATNVERWLTSWPEPVVPLLDAHDPVWRGGTGRKVDWTRAAAIARRRRLILSGGLRAGNVAEAIRLVHPWGVDVSSGVELSPGVKDADRLRGFFRAVAAANDALDGVEADADSGERA
jgi:phosphoribosylanthranilate isomerase